MAQMIFVNLPVTDLQASIRFYEAIGAVKDERICKGDEAAMMSLTGDIHFMLLTHDHIRRFTTKRIVDPKTEVQALFCLSAESREAVNAIADKAAAVRGVGDIEAPEDHGFMYSRAFEDPDGHAIQVMWMDIDAAMAAMSQPQPEAA